MSNSENNGEDLNAFTVVDEANEEELNNPDENADEACEEELNNVDEAENVDEANEEELNNSGGDVENVEEAETADTVEENNLEGVTVKEEQENVNEGIVENSIEPESAVVKQESPKLQNVDKFTLEPSTPEEDHPYLDLIENFEYPEEQLTITPIEDALPVSKTPRQLIETRAALIKLLQTLRSVKEIAIYLLVDTKSFNKQIHVMALSTKETDYVIDVLKLKNELLLLSEIFTNPKIVKVLFTTSKLTMSCLQNNLCLYVVNLFDTSKAAMALFGRKFPTLNEILKKNYSLAAKYLKKPLVFQKRPVREDVLEYCRTRSHFLIHIYYDYKNQLLAKDEELYRNVLQQCRDASKIMHCDHHQEEIENLERSLQNRHKAELEFLKKMYAWRTNVAREMNKNPNEIMDKAVLLRFASHLPTDVNTVHQLGKSEYVRKASEEIIRVGKEISRQNKLAFTKLKVQPYQQNNVHEELKRKLPPPTPIPAPPNKQAKLDKSPNITQQAPVPKPKRFRPRKNDRFGFKPNKPAFFNIPPFLSQNTMDVNARNPRFSPPRGNNRYFQQEVRKSPPAPFQARFQNSTFRDDGNNTGGYNRDYNESLMGPPRNNSNFNRGPSRDYDLNILDREVNSVQRRNNFQNRNDGYGNSRGWRN